MAGMRKAKLGEGMITETAKTVKKAKKTRKQRLDEIMGEIKKTRR